jgi:hypothetical protein
MGHGTRLGARGAAAAGARLPLVVISFGEHDELEREIAMGGAHHAAGGGFLGGAGRRERGARRAYPETRKLG